MYQNLLLRMHASARCESIDAYEKGRFFIKGPLMASRLFVNIFGRALCGTKRFLRSAIKCGDGDWPKKSSESVAFVACHVLGYLEILDNLNKSQRRTWILMWFDLHPLGSDEDTHTRTFDGHSLVSSTVFCIWSTRCKACCSYPEYLPYCTVVFSARSRDSVTGTSHH